MAQSSTFDQQFESACLLLQTHVDGGEITAAVLHVRRGKANLTRAFGTATVDLPFLIASPTKPMTATAVLWLRDRGDLSLDDPVKTYLPEFDGGQRGDVTIRHLLSHMSGLPDMLPENVELRRRHAPLSTFVARACRTPLLFPPGTKVRYQSMGVLLAAAIVEKVSGEAMPAFMLRHVFTPLQMRETSFGLGGRQIAATAACQVPAAERSDWDWNSTYWRTLGAPWGGAHATARDLVTFLESFVEPGALLREATCREMRQVQTGDLRPRFGLGWQRDPGAFGASCSPDTFGHFGSTGTICWHDPASRTTFALLTTRPATDSMATVLLPASTIIGRA